MQELVAGFVILLVLAAMFVIPTLGFLFFGFTLGKSMLFGFGCFFALLCFTMTITETFSDSGRRERDYFIENFDRLDK